MIRNYNLVSLCVCPLDPLEEVEGMFARFAL